MIVSIVATVLGALLVYAGLWIALGLGWAFVFAGLALVTTGLLVNLPDREPSEM